MEKSRRSAFASAFRTVLGRGLIECGPLRARACCESLLKKFDFWGTMGGTQKSGQLESTEKSQFSSRSIAGDRTFGRQLPRTAVQFLNLESILPLTNGLCVFLATVLKITSRTQGTYGKLTNV